MRMKRLRAVKRPRWWLAGAILCFAVVLTVGVSDTFFRESDPWRLIVIWGFGVPSSLIGCWLLSVWRRSYDRARRIEREHCPYCDYDLRATPERCPECGTVAQHLSSPSAASAAGGIARRVR